MQKVSMMIDRKVIYFEMDSLTKKYTPYQIKFIFNRENQGKEDNFSTLYLTHFLGSNEMNEQKEILIADFLEKYFRKKENFLWTYQESSSFENDELVVVISRL